MLELTPELLPWVTAVSFKHNRTEESGGYRREETGGEDKETEDEEVMMRSLIMRR